MDQFLFGIFQIDKNYFKILVQNLYYTLNVKPRCQIFTTIHLRHLCTHKIQNNSKGTAKNIFGRKKFGGRIAPNLVAVLPPILAKGAGKHFVCSGTVCTACDYDIGLII